MLALSYYTILADFQVHVVRFWMEALWWLPTAFIEEEEVNLEWGRSLITLFRSHELRVFEVYRIEHFSRLSSDPLQSTVSVIFRSRSTGPWIRPLRGDFRTWLAKDWARQPGILVINWSIWSRRCASKSFSLAMPNLEYWEIVFPTHPLKLSLFLGIYTPGGIGKAYFSSHVIPFSECDGIK